MNVIFEYVPTGEGFDGSKVYEWQSAKGNGYACWPGCSACGSWNTYSFIPKKSSSLITEKKSDKDNK